jgi:hypothetical protein
MKMIVGFFLGAAVLIGVVVMSSATADKPSSVSSAVKRPDAWYPRTG